MFIPPPTSLSARLLAGVSVTDEAYFGCKIIPFDFDQLVTMTADIGIDLLVAFVSHTMIDH